jgi:predicted metal-dependent hydrolase
VTRAAPDAQLSLFQTPAAADFEVRESRRARRMSIRVFPHGRIEVVVPRRTRAAEVAQFVASQRPWIARSLAAMADTGAAAEVSLPDQILFSAVSERWSVEYRAGSRVRLSASAGDDGADIRLTTPDRDHPQTRRRLRRWVRDQGERTLLPWLARLAGAHGFEYRDASIGRQKTRWGSCSSAGRIRLNCSLLFLAPAQAEHVMLHELCHLRVLNHGPRFWSLLERLQPGARALDAELRTAWSRVPGWLFYD